MACLRFALGGDIKHVMYTDSSSARQLASHQGVGRVRHFCGKVLWIQDKTNAGEITLRQVGTTWNLADIGTKALAQHRLFVLMNETGMNTFEEVGAEEHQRQVEKTGNNRQLQRIAKIIMNMGIAMGPEPTGVMGQSCPSPGTVSEELQMQRGITYGMIFMMVVDNFNGCGGNSLMEENQKVWTRCLLCSGAIGRSLRLCNMVV